MDVAGPLKFNGQRLENPYFVACIDIASRYAFTIPMEARTEVIPFVEKTVKQYIDVFGKPLASLVVVSDNAKEYVSVEMKKLMNFFISNIEQLHL